MDECDRRHRAALETPGWMLGLQVRTGGRAERAEHVRWLGESSLNVIAMLRMGHVYCDIADFPY